VTTAALASLYGLPAWKFLTTTDPEERLILSAIVKRADELVEIQQRSLAAHIVNTYGKARRRG
jgi:hypothetical protein